MRKTVDGFGPKKPIGDYKLKSASEAAQQISGMPRRTPVQHVNHRMPLKPGHKTRPLPAVRSIDGMVTPGPRRIPVPAKVDEVWQARPRVGFDTPSFINDPIAKGQPHTKASKFRKLLALLQYPIVAILALVAVYSVTIGQWLVVAYAVYVLIRRVDSRSTFIGALLLLIAVPVFQLLNQPGVAEHIAVYTYELLVVGTLQAIIELVLVRSHKKSMVQ